MLSHTSLDAAAQERKARLAKLKSLKRKQPESAGADDEEESNQPNHDEQPGATPFLSGRNFDLESRGPKLGFEHNPSKDQDTAELRAEQLDADAKAEQAKEQQEDKPLDLFKLQPKKPNWDLKRDLDKKMEQLHVRTDNAIARLVRERISAQNQAGNAEAVGMVGEELVSTIHAREQEEAEDERKEREEAAELVEGFT